MERKEITAWGMNTWTKKHGLIMFDGFAIGKIKESITNFVAQQAGDGYGEWECIDIKTLETCSSYDVADIRRGDMCFYAGRTLKVQCAYAGDLVAYCFSSLTHIDYVDAVYKFKFVLVKKSK